MRTFISGSGIKISTSDKLEIKKMKACGWKEKKEIKQFFAKNLESGNPFLK